MLTLIYEYFGESSTKGRRAKIRRTKHCR